MNVFGPYFSEEELGITDITAATSRNSLYLLVKFGLNPVRKKYGPVKIDSGLRSMEHNIAIGGVNDSQHCIGEAADFICTALPADITMRQVFEDLRTWWPGQLIYYSIRGHIHMALPRIDLQVKGRLIAFINDEK